MRTSCRVRLGSGGAANQFQALRWITSTEVGNAGNARSKVAGEGGRGKVQPRRVYKNYGRGGGGEEEEEDRESRMCKSLTQRQEAVTSTPGDH